MAGNGKVRLNLTALEELERRVLAEPEAPKRERPETLVDALAANLAQVERAIQLPGSNMSVVARALGIRPSNFPSALARARRQLERGGPAPVGRPAGRKDRTPRKLRPDAAESGSKGGKISRPTPRTPPVVPVHYQAVARREAFRALVQGVDRMEQEMEPEEYGALPTSAPRPFPFSPTWAKEGAGFVDLDEPNL